MSKLYFDIHFAACDVFLWLFDYNEALPEKIPRAKKGIYIEIRQKQIFIFDGNGKQN